MPKKHRINQRRCIGRKHKSYKLKETKQIDNANPSTSCDIQIPPIFNPPDTSIPHLHEFSPNCNTPDKSLPNPMEPKKEKLLCERSTRLAITMYYTNVLDTPTKIQWIGQNGTIATIARTLKISKGSSRMILNVLNDVTDCLARGLEYDGSREQIDNVRESRKLKAGSLDEQLIANWMEDGLGFRLTTMLLNSHRQQQGLPLVGLKSVYNAIHRMSPRFSRIEKKPQTAENLDLWSEARMNWVSQLLIRSNSITNNDLPNNLQTKPYFDEKALEENTAFFSWSQVAHFDEIHIDQKAVHVSSDGYHIQFLRDESGKLVAPNNPMGSYCNVRVSLFTTFIFNICSKIVKHT